MILLDVNVLVTLYRVDAPHHQVVRRWWQDYEAGNGVFGVSDLALSGFLRIVTHSRIFKPPTPMADALVLCDQLWSHPQGAPTKTGARHWQIFRRLCVEAGAKGGLVPDAYFAALAIENGCEWVTLDRDFARFPGLKWRSPLERT